ncbi:MAG: cytochrome c peroxidase [Hansschlegelia sp.]
MDALPRLAAAALVAGVVFVVGVLGTAESRGDSNAITPIAALSTNPDKVALGKRLFYDARLSNDGRTSCADCHDLAKGGVDSGKARAKTTGDSGFDTLSVFNAALNYRLNWLGEFGSLEESNDASISDPNEMATSWSAVLHTLQGDPVYSAEFEEVYGPDWDKRAVLDALVEFERSLVTPDSRFDRFLRGQEGAIDAEEEQGYRLFEGYGCISCHQGRNVGGNLLQKFGVFANPNNAQRQFKRADLGRITLTGLERDRFVFRVPSLRNVAMTAPYLHDGSVGTLEEVVAIMGRTQLGRELDQQDIALIVKFLRTLTGKYQGVSLDKSETSGKAK